MSFTTTTTTFLSRNTTTFFFSSSIGAPYPLLGFIRSVIPSPRSRDVDSSHSRPDSPFLSAIHLRRPGSFSVSPTHGSPSPPRQAFCPRHLHSHHTTNCRCSRKPQQQPQCRSQACAAPPASFAPSRRPLSPCKAWLAVPSRQSRRMASNR